MVCWCRVAVVLHSDKTSMNVNKIKYVEIFENSKAVTRDISTYVCRWFTYASSATASNVITAAVEKLL